MSGARPDEDELIRRYFAPLATDPGAAALIDDAATLTPVPGHDLVVTTDALVEAVHFFPADAPFDLARKALRVNLSDLAAKGARPLGYLLTLALPADWTETWLEAFAAGLAADQTDFGLSLLGGDTVRTPGPLTISITAIGSVEAGRAVRRSGARPGDAVLVTGTIGGAGLGCRLLYDRTTGQGLSAEHVAAAERRYHVPEPRVAAASTIRDYATAAMDVSDGFAGDLAKLCRASGVAALVRAEDVPLDPAARAWVCGDAARIAAALSGGDDYEILFTVPGDAAAAAIRACAAAGVECGRVGDIVAGTGSTITFGEAPLPIGRGSYSHF